MTVVNFIDTSVFAPLIKVPGFESEHAEIAAEFDRRLQSNELFVLPVTTIIETGNHIANSKGDRRAAATRLVKALSAARNQDPPWTVRDLPWDREFLDSFIAGDSTGSSLIDNFSSGTIGGGDLAILVERDRYQSAVSGAVVRVWTLDNHLMAHGDGPTA